MKVLFFYNRGRMALFACCLFFSLQLFSQDTLSINEVKIVTYIVKQNLLQSTVAASLIDSTQLKLQSVNSFVAAFNSVPGVRMEERSPGSYRLSIRGSLLRSPFGIRNIKIYLDDYPLTDAGGNSYLNLIGTNAAARIEILKGPDGSIFGANSGGVVNITTQKKGNDITTGLSGGSYGLLKQTVHFSQLYNNHFFNFAESYYKSDGYRQNSRMHRTYLQGGDNWQYSKNNSLAVLLFYSNLFYQTPGGLTYLQYQNNPMLARQPTATLPGAIEQKAAVYNENVFGGITHTAQITSWLRNVASVFASSVDFKNPFITNFEVRKENTYGGRAYFILETDKNKIRPIQFEYNIGAEWQQTKSAIQNYNNVLGDKAGLLAAGKITSAQYFIFNRLKAVITDRLTLEAGVSLNYYRYNFIDSFNLRNAFTPQWMPRFGVNYEINKQLSLRSSLSKGYSPPTTAEIRPSDNNIYRQLQPETGNNIEFGVRYFSLRKKYWLDISYYHYNLTNAIVRQQNNAGTEYFLNAGGTNQNGFEMQSSFSFISPWQNEKIKKLQLSTSITSSDFKFKNYAVDTSDYSGNFLTGVPKFVIVTNMLLEFKNGFFVFAQHNHTSSISLNDANSVLAKPYKLIQAKIGYTCITKHNLKLEINAGVDNVLNEVYSLGNDLNAAAGRFYNAAPKRNFYTGIIISK